MEIFHAEFSPSPAHNLGKCKFHFLRMANRLKYIRILIIFCFSYVDAKSCEDKFLTKNCEIQVNCENDFKL